MTEKVSSIVHAIWKFAKTSFHIKLAKFARFHFFLIRDTNIKGRLKRGVERLKEWTSGDYIIELQWKLIRTKFCCT